MNEFPNAKISIETEIGGVPFSTSVIIDLSSITDENLNYSLTGKLGLAFKGLIKSAKQLAEYKSTLPTE